MAKERKTCYICGKGNEIEPLLITSEGSVHFNCSSKDKLSEKTIEVMKALIFN